MFEFMYAKKMKDNELMKFVEANMDKYHTQFTFKENGTVEVFFGSRREEEQTNE